MSTTPKIYLVCNPLTCYDIIRSLKNQRSYSSYFSVNSNLSKIPVDNYVSSIGVTQIDYLVQEIRKSGNDKPLYQLGNVQKQNKNGKTTRVYSSITCSSIETALRVFESYSDFSVKVIPNINNVVHNLKQPDLGKRNRALLENINNRKLKEDMIDVKSVTSSNIGRYCSISLNEFDSFLKTLTEDAVVFCDYVFISQYLRRLQSGFNEVIEPTSVFELEKDGAKIKFTKKVYPAFGAASSYKKEGSYYFYKFKDKLLPLLPLWIKNPSNNRSVNKPVPFITDDIIKPCINSQYIKKYLEKTPYKTNESIKSNTRISSIHSNFEHVLANLTR